VDGQLHTVINQRGELVKDFKRLGGEARRYGGRGFRERRQEPSGPELDEPQPREIVDALEAKGLLPAIYFLFSRNDCQVNAERLAMMRAPLSTVAQQERIEAIIDAHLGQLRPEDFELEQVKSIISLARKGIGFHHAGLLPILKQLVEVLFNQGLMQVVFATDTLALGVNMPARTVVIGRMSKWDGRRRRMLIPNEFQQMAGRAGRRGMDRLGHVVVPYSPWFTFREMLEIATGELLPVRSAFSIRYNTVLNLWDPPEGERVRQVLQQSLAQFQTSQRIRQIENDIVEVGGDIAMVPQGCLIGYDEGDNLLEDYRALVNTLTALQGRLRRTQDEFDQLLLPGLNGRPWPEPGRQALRKVFRAAAPGIVVHSRQHGWGVFLGRGGRGGVGRFLFGDRIALVVEYREIDYLFDEASVTLPLGLVEPPDDVEDPLELVAPAELDVVRRQLASFDLPDLEAQVAEYQAREHVRLREQEEILREQIAAITGEIEELEAQRDLHPCHFCERRKEHRNNLARVDRLQQERNALEDLLAQEIDAEEARIRGVIRGIRDVLHRFGYLRRGYPTAKADMLADIFDNDGLILCEMVERGWLDRLEPEDVAEVFSWFCYDRDARFMNHYTLSPQLVSLRRRLEDLEGDILGEERDHGLFISEGHNQAFYGAARAWCTGASLASISETIELSEGDLVLTINKTIDLMRQVREMLADVMPDHPLRLTLRLAEGLLRRGIVEQSLTIGFAPVIAPDDVPDDAEPEEPEEPDGNDDTERFEYELPPVEAVSEAPEGPVVQFETSGDDLVEPVAEPVTSIAALPSPSKRRRASRRVADRAGEGTAGAIQAEAAPA
jgi:ATP-dependent RNA helicase HelY